MLSSCFARPSSSPGWFAAARSPRGSSSAISLERIEQLDPHLNAFVEVDGERALAVADEIDPGDPRPFAGVPIAIKNNRAVSGLRLTNGLRPDERLRRRLRPQRGPPAQTGGLRRRGHDDAARVRHPADLRGAPVRSDPQPLGSGSDPGGLLGRLGGGRRRRDGPRGPWQRWRRFDSHPGGLLRPRRPEGPTRADLLGPRARRLDAARRGRAQPDGRGHGRDPRRDRRLRAGGRQLGAAAGDPFARAAESGLGSGALRIAATASSPLPDATVDPQAAGAVWEAAELLRSLGHSVEEVEPPWRAEGLDVLFGLSFAPKSPSR